MEADKQGGLEINYSTNSGLMLTSRQSYHSVGGETAATGSSSGSGFIHHSETHFDHSSTDETVIPCMLGERTSREYISTTSIGQFDPESSPKSHISRTTRRSIDTDLCGTLYEETLQLDLDMNHRQTTESTALSAVPDKDDADDGAEESHENERLVSSPVPPSSTRTKTADRHEKGRIQGTPY